MLEAKFGGPGLDLIEGGGGVGPVESGEVAGAAEGGGGIGGAEVAEDDADGCDFVSVAVGGFELFGGVVDGHGEVFSVQF